MLLDEIVSSITPTKNRLSWRIPVRLLDCTRVHRPTLASCGETSFGGDCYCRLHRRHFPHCPSTSHRRRCHSLTSSSSWPPSSLEFPWGNVVVESCLVSCSVLAVSARRVSMMAFEKMTSFGKFFILLDGLFVLLAIVSLQ